MKKKLLLASLFLSTLFANAQTVVWSDDFEDEDISDWTLIDADGDGLNWGDIFTVNNSAGDPVTPVSLISRSWQGVPLTPDNWAISPSIDLPASSEIELSWVVQAAAAAWSLENYAVYVGTGGTTDELEDSDVTFTEVYPGGTTGASLSRTLDLSSFAGQTVYVAFRHFDCTDQDFLSVDDVTITATALSTQDFFAHNFSVYPNPSNSLVNLNSKTNAAINTVQVTDLNGRVVKSVNANGVMQTQVNIADLSNGMYLMTVQTEAGTGTTKIVKN